MDPVPAPPRELTYADGEIFPEDSHRYDAVEAVLPGFELPVPEAFE